MLVPKTGFEPVRGYPQRFLSPVSRLPQPFAHVFFGFPMRSRNPLHPLLFAAVGGLGCS